MATTISISDTDEGIWIIKNTLYCLFIELVLTNNVLKDSICERLRMSIDFNGLSLEDIDNRDEAIQTSRALKLTSEMIVDKKISHSFNSQTIELFAELKEMLTNWEETLK